MWTARKTTHSKEMLRCRPTDANRGQPGRCQPLVVTTPRLTETVSRISETRPVPRVRYHRGLGPAMASTAQDPPETTWGGAVGGTVAGGWAAGWKVAGGEVEVGEETSGWWVRPVTRREELAGCLVADAVGFGAVLSGGRVDAEAAPAFELGASPEPRA